MRLEMEEMRGHTRQVYEREVQTLRESYELVAKQLQASETHRAELELKYSQTVSQ